MAGQSRAIGNDDEVSGADIRRSSTGADPRGSVGAGVTVSGCRSRTERSKGTRLVARPREALRWHVRHQGERANVSFA